MCKLMVNVCLRLCHEYFFNNMTIKKCCFYAHLMDMKIIKIIAKAKKILNDVILTIGKKILCSQFFFLEKTTNC